jgi:sn-glycerol 3-phosphate transport system permease protein
MTKQYEFPSKGLPYLLVLPQMVIVVIFFFLPAAQAFWQSLFIQDPFGLSSTFVGTENYLKLFRDPTYFASLWRSFAYAALVACTAMATALFLAVQANRRIRGASVYKTLLIWPYAVATMIAGVLWLFMFNPNVGIVAWLLQKKLGVDWNYLVKSAQAFFLVTIAASWKQISYNFVFFLAGLQSVPAALVEAAEIDGASRMGRFWGIVFPMLSPTTFYLVVMNIVYAFFETFPIIHQVTSGGPGQATSILVYKVWKDGFINMDLSGSATQSVVLMVIVVALTVVQFRFVERRVAY